MASVAPHTHKPTARVRHGRLVRAIADLREQTLIELAKSDTTDVVATRRAVTEAATVLVGVDRAGIWTRHDGKLVCDDLFLRDEARHLSGQVIQQSVAPTYFASIEQSLALRVNDARNDPRTQELEESYLRPLGIGAMLDTPIWLTGGICGVLCCEHLGGPRRWRLREEKDASRLAGVVARALESSARRAAEERWRIVINAIPEIVLVVDAAGTIVEANAAARQLAAQEGGTVIDERFRGEVEVRDLAGHVLPWTQWPSIRAARGELVRGEVIEVNSKVTGAQRWFLVTAAPIAVGGRSEGAAAVYADVEDEVRIERVKHECLSRLAHELRTPATIAKGFAQRLLSSIEDGDDEATRALAAIVHAGERMGRLADKLVDLSMITLGRIILARSEVDFVELVRHTVLRTPAATTHDVRVRGETSPMLVLADPSRIGTIVKELLENAARHSPRGSTIDVELRKEGDRATVIVTDAGEGIPLSARPHVFEPFFRARAGDPHDVDGLGLGLFLAREIAIRHGGSMWFEAPAEGGSRFALWLPLEKGASS